MVEGDPLTGALPVTRVLVPEVLGPIRKSRNVDMWPKVADPEAVTFEKIRPGAIVSVRTRFGVRNWMLRTTGRTRDGRRWFSGMDRKGFCHSALFSQIISVDAIKVHQKMLRKIELRALASGYPCSP